MIDVKPFVKFVDNSVTMSAIWDQLSKDDLEIISKQSGIPLGEMPFHRIWLVYLKTVNGRENWDTISRFDKVLGFKVP